jgi:hypothetical protein
MCLSMFLQGLAPRDSRNACGHNAVSKIVYISTMLFLGHYNIAVHENNPLVEFVKIEEGVPSNTPIALSFLRRRR